VNSSTSVPIVNMMPDAYRFHFLSHTGSLTTSTIYFEGRNPAAGVNEKNFLGSIEFIHSKDQETCFELVYSSEKRKIDAFAGFIEEQDDEFLFEFSTVFTTGGVEYSNYHLVDQQPDSQLFHVTLLRGFSNEDIQLIKQFSQSINFVGIAEGLTEGDVLEIAFEQDSITDSVGQLKYLN
jgi:hypothetical protein